MAKNNEVIKYRPDRWLTSTLQIILCFANICRLLKFYGSRICKTDFKKGETIWLLSIVLQPKYLNVIRYILPVIWINQCLLVFSVSKIVSIPYLYIWYLGVAPHSYLHHIISDQLKSLHPACIESTQRLEDFEFFSD